MPRRGIFDFHITWRASGKTLLCPHASWLLLLWAIHGLSGISGPVRSLVSGLVLRPIHVMGYIIAANGLRRPCGIQSIYCDWVVFAAKLLICGWFMQLLCQSVVGPCWHGRWSALRCKTCQWIVSLWLDEWKDSRRICFFSARGSSCTQTCRGRFCALGWI